MAEIETYQCSNNECKLTLRLGRDFPVWKSDTPRHLQTPVPTPEAKTFVDRYRNDVVCLNCKKVVDTSGSEFCPQCNTESIRIEQSGTACTRCEQGTLSLTRVVVY